MYKILIDGICTHTGIYLDLFLFTTYYLLVTSTIARHVMHLWTSQCIIFEAYIRFLYSFNSFITQVPLSWIFMLLGNLNLMSSINVEQFSPDNPLVDCF